MDLVKIENGQIMTDSLVFADEFGLLHSEVLKKINNLIGEFSLVRSQFIKDVFVNNRNREYPYFKITRDGYMTLVMNTNAKGKSRLLLMEKKQLFIKAFNKLEELLLREKTNKNNLEWKKSRQQGIEVRNQLTDVIKSFVEYATNQGSSHSKMYYANITKMEYKALGIMQENVPSLRDTFDNMQLFQLILAEDLVKKQIKKYMSQNLHYKEIYLLVKQDLFSFTKSLMIET